MANIIFAHKRKFIWHSSVKKKLFLPIKFKNQISLFINQIFLCMKKILLFSMIALFSLTALAQLNTRENADPYVFKTGTRPQQGDCGIYIGPSFTEIIQMIDDDINWRGMPMCNFKYYASDQFVFRLGLQIYNKSQGLTVKQREPDSVDTKNSKSQTYFLITPAIEHHFTPKNICDVYIGANLPLGVNSIVEKASYTVGKDKLYHNRTQNQFLLGIGAYIGLQFFVADLPFAIGIEGGLSGLGKFGGAVKNVLNEMNEQNEYEVKKYYTYNDRDFGQGMVQAKKISTSKFELGYDFRLTFSYYFNK